MQKKSISLFVLFFFLLSLFPLENVKVFASTTAPGGISAVLLTQYLGPRVNVSWTAVTGATGYKVFRSEDGGVTYTEVGSTTTAITYTDTTVTSGESYSYKVSALTASGESDKSSAATALIKDPVYKFDIGQNNVEQGYTKIGNGYGGVATTLYTEELGYGFTTTTNGRDRGDYNATTPANAVYRDFAFVNGTTFKVKLPVGTYSINFICGSTNTDSAGSTTVTVGGKQIISLSFSSGKVVEGYAVVPVTTTDPLVMSFGGGGQAKLNGMIITPLTPGPTDLKVDAVDVESTPMHIDLSWTAVQESSGYNIYRKAAEDSAFTKVGTTLFPSYKDETVKIGKTYSYYITNISANGEAPSAVIDNIKAVNPAVAVPAVPIGLAANRQPNSASLTWTKDTSALYYNIYRKTATESSYNLLASLDATSAESYTDSGLVGNMNYTYQLRALNSGGESEPATVDANALIPSVPSDIIIEKAGWSVAELLSIAKDDAIGCKVYRSETIDGTYTLLGDAVQGLNAYRYKDTGLTAQKDYYYKFTAYNYTGESQTTNPVKVTTKNVIAKPDAPESISLNSITKSGANYTVRVEWTYSYGATSYNVYRSTSPDSGFQKIGTSTNGVYLDTITNGVENTAYYYKVSSVNVSGESAASTVLPAKITSNFRTTVRGITAASQMPASQAITLNWTAVSGADSYNIYRALKGDYNYTKIGTSTTNSYDDTTGVLGSTYEYRATSVSNLNGESLKSFALKIDWSSVQGESIYTVQRKGKWDKDTDYQTIGTASTNSYLDDTALAGSYYTYRIMDSSTNILNTETYNLTPYISGDTNATMDIQAWYVPVSLIDTSVSVIKDKVTELSYVYDRDTFKLNWQHVAGATSYNVYKSTAKDSGYHFIGNSSTNDLAYDGNDEARTNYYKVTALNAGGESEKSEVLVVVPKVTLKRQMEKLDRGVVAVKTANGVLVNWRLLGTDSPEISFNVYRDGVKLNSQAITSKTNYLDASGTADSKYYVAAVLNNSEVEKTETVTTWASNYKDIPLKPVAPGITPAGEIYTYSPNDSTVADLDGDGKYEIVVNWQPSNAHDNSQGGYTGNTIIDAYELDGTFMWRIDLGKNIRSGAHYTDVIVYDFDGDGKAEVSLRTADGSIDGQGNIIGDEDKDYRNSSGYVLNGPEYTTVFEGTTGKALATEPFGTQRGVVGDWGDTYGNRVDRFIAGVAYIDGKTPCFVEQRGYYTRIGMTAYSYKDGKITEQWHFDSNIDDLDPNGVPYKGYKGQGNHQMSVGDVDGDGRDEIITGPACIDDNGKALYTTGIGHGDAMHLSDLDPTRPGLELFQVHEDTAQKYGIEMHDAQTGEVLWGFTTGKDTGRGLSADIDPRYPGEEVWAGIPSNDGPINSSAIYNAQGVKITDTTNGPSINFAIWWDGDLSRELLDHNWPGYTTPQKPSPGKIDKWDYVNNTVVNLFTAYGTSSNNVTKGNPAIQADIYGDWREEVIWRLEDNSALRIYVTPYETDTRIFTLMHDPIYRLGVAWQNTGYNQPPHTSFFLGSGMGTLNQPDITMKTGGEEVLIDRTAPIIQTPDKLTFIQGEAIEIPINAVDDITGIDKIEINFNGQTTTGSAIYADSLSMSTGEYSINVTAYDKAGNKGEKNFTLNITIDITNLDELIKGGASKGLIDEKGVANSLLAKVNKIQQYENVKERLRNSINAMQQEVTAQNGKHIAADFARIILEDLKAIESQMNN